MNLDSLRDELRRREDESLAAYATRSSDTRGRVHAESEHPFRLPFQRDRDRIIHSTAFRRLEYKTQVFVNHEGDYYRTRLTHSIEAGQITRTLCRVLGLNEDLGEAVALSHDLGHTPFGHAGERVLDKLMEPYGGFEHNAQSLRIVDLLEERYPGFPGLNLSWEVREGIVKHSSEYDRPLVRQFAPEVQPVLEAQIVDFADEIAYNSHDIDDGLKSGMLEERDLASATLWTEAREAVRREHGDASESIQRYQTVRRIIDRLVTDMIAAILERIAEHGIRTLADVRACPVRLAGLSPVVAEHNRELKGVLLDRLYRHHRVTRMTVKAQRVMTALFQTYMEEPQQMPPHVYQRIDVDDPKPRVVADYIAGMTDRFAFDEYRKLFDPDERV
ncbi:MAG: deoxyguanosinetriphosphate triphosphohydrolase [Polyangiaceae bacterium UTPRO1]|jgi:dGTPase|nr:deoxyguanosinetriphosphate triphosphohydrolase [Myxococcales bacterium]OQY68941.1 MAG: deoxyguanosinetriphosphate triphosphohydrolase [Polyangiaceae bacterium UTPRO1]